MPTLNVCSDVWDHVEIYVMHLLLVSRLKIILSSNLKLIISFLVLLFHTSCYHLLEDAARYVKHCVSP
jgi:hypothetical protein